MQHPSSVILLQDLLQAPPAVPFTDLVKNRLEAAVRLSRIKEVYDPIRECTGATADLSQFISNFTALPVSGKSLDYQKIHREICALYLLGVFDYDYCQEWLDLFGIEAGHQVSLSIEDMTISQYNHTLKGGFVPYLDPLVAMVRHKSLAKPQVGRGIIGTSYGTITHDVALTVPWDAVPYVDEISVWEKYENENGQFPISVLNDVYNSLVKYGLCLIPEGRLFKISSFTNTSPVRWMLKHAKGVRQMSHYTFTAVCHNDQQAGVEELYLIPMVFALNLITSSTLFIV